MGEKDYDPVMHSAEHLVNGTIAHMLGCGRAFSTHIEKKKSKCDFRFSRNMTQEELEEAETRVNGQIAAQLDVYDEILSVADAAAFYSLSRLPEETETVRIVHIGAYDACPCIGNHVANTSEIPLISLISSDCADGVLRVRFKFKKS